MQAIANNVGEEICKLLMSLPSGEPNISEVTDFVLFFMLYIIGH